MRLSNRFFVQGSTVRAYYGGYPRIQFNESQKPSLRGPSWLDADLRLLENTLGIAFFEYGPRLWMIGEVEPLKALQRKRSRGRIIERVLKEYPVRELEPEVNFYRIRIHVQAPDKIEEYDSPPAHKVGKGRLDTPECPILYASQDMEVCLHECRVSAEDDIYVATLSPTRTLKLLDLTHILDESTTEFESLDMAVHMLFLAGQHSYQACKAIALAAEKAGFDGLYFPSYFSLLRTGSYPFETTYGIAHRRVPSLREQEMAKIVPNIALFRRPIQDGRVRVKCINRVLLGVVRYGAQLGPVGV